MSLADTKLLAKTNVYSGEHDGKERRSTWSVKMKAFCAAMTPRLCELMSSASKQEVEIGQDATTPSDPACSTNLYCIRSLFTDGEALDIVQNGPVNNVMEVLRRMVTRLEPKVSPGFEECCKHCCSQNGTSLT